ncbi:MAG: ABC transporter permease [Erysipelothrix sp.]|nr:ABC transporter permease [Erysipelothrix sp.]
MKNNKFTNSLRSLLDAVFPSLLSIVVGLLIGGLILLLANPANAGIGFWNLIKGPIGTNPIRGLGNILYYATPIMLTGLSVAFAFKTGLFNIGASGQYLMGGFASLVFGVKATFIPVEYRWIFAILAAFLAGAIMAGITGVLKAVFNVNEVISSIMFNYISVYTVVYLIKEWNLYNPLRNEAITIPTKIPMLGLDKIFPGSFVQGGAVVALLAAVVIYVIIEKTTFGYELKAVGYNRDAAKYAGINEKRSIILSMFIAGGLAGMAGAVNFLVGSNRHIALEKTVPLEGFNGIPVALLANSHPIGVIFSSLFIGYLRLNAQAMQTYGFVPEIIDIVIAVILYSSALTVLFRSISTKYLSRRKQKKDIKEEVA